MSNEQKDLIFHLFIVENGNLSDEILNTWKQDKHILKELSNDEIRTSAHQTADAMNKKVGHEIY